MRKQQKEGLVTTSTFVIIYPSWTALSTPPHTS
nr:MAG TPA: hypothetical protein [Caudoviricetes sp.]